MMEQVVPSQKQHTAGKHSPALPCRFSHPLTTYHFTWRVSRLHSRSVAGGLGEEIGRAMVGEVEVMFSDLRLLIYCLALYKKVWRAARSLNRYLNVDRHNII